MVFMAEQPTLRITLPTTCPRCGTKTTFSEHQDPRCPKCGHRFSRRTLAELTQKKAVSPVVATLLLIALAVAAGTLVYLFASFIIASSP